MIIKKIKLYLNEPTYADYIRLFLTLFPDPSPRSDYRKPNRYSTTLPIASATK